MFPTKSTPYHYIFINSSFFNKTVKNLRYSSIMVPSLYFTLTHSIYLWDLRKPILFPLKWHFSDHKLWQRYALHSLKTKFPFSSFFFSSSRQAIAPPPKPAPCVTWHKWFKRGLRPTQVLTKTLTKSSWCRITIYTATANVLAVTLCTHFYFGSLASVG